MEQQRKLLFDAFSTKSIKNEVSTLFHNANIYVEARSGDDEFRIFIKTPH